ncbi:MAG: histidine phosphatase family protein [Verrucomicrobiales bacterium]|nr:histidine phosphatase family protein [Verrucomicrobiales bacterium]
MKQLLLIRHAKSSWDFPGASDHDRPLNERGGSDAPKMGAALAQRGVSPDAIVTSTANRAKTTAGIIAEGLGFSSSSIREERDLYLASPQAILRVVQQIDESCETALLFGHNPGMHDAVEMICGAPVDHFPTLAVARIELDIDYWGEVDSGTGLLLELLTPRALKTD